MSDLHYDFFILVHEKDAEDFKKETGLDFCEPHNKNHKLVEFIDWGSGKFFPWDKVISFLEKHGGEFAYNISGHGTGSASHRVFGDFNPMYEIVNTFNDRTGRIMHRIYGYNQD